MKSNKITKIVGLASICILFQTSCSKDYLNLTRNNSITDDNFYKTEDDAIRATNAVYTPLQGVYNGAAWQILDIMSDDADKLQRMVTALHLAFQRWGLLISIGKTKSMTVYVPRPGEELPPPLVIYIGNQRIEHVNKFKYLGQIISSDGKLKGEISRRIGQAYTAFRNLEKQGIWKDKTISRRVKLTIYKVTALSILLYCSETWPIGPDEVKKLETVQMMCLRRICGDRSWGRDSTPYAVIRKKCQTPTIQNLITYHRLRWLGKVSRMQEDRLPIRILFGTFAGQLPIGRPPKTWLEYVKDDLWHLSEIREKRGVMIKWWSLCQDKTAWTSIIKKVVEIHT
jgi:hypothetical protein